jgi:hypothetical protein
VNYWSHFGAIGDFRGLQVIDFVVPGARIATVVQGRSASRWQHDDKKAAQIPVSWLGAG